MRKAQSWEQYKCSVSGATVLIMQGDTGAQVPLHVEVYPLGHPRSPRARSNAGASCLILVSKTESLKGRGPYTFFIQGSLRAGSGALICQLAEGSRHTPWSLVMGASSC